MKSLKKKNEKLDFRKMMYIEDDGIKTMMAHNNQTHSKISKMINISNYASNYFAR